jgi:hypothetical protein
MDRRIASLAQAKLCRTRAEADPQRRAYWMAEAVKWQQRADDQAECGDSAAWAAHWRRCEVP